MPRPPSAFYIGFDPTAPSLHVGSLLGLVVATHLRLAGYRPLLVVGGATARIGDPSFRESAKRRLQDEALTRFAANIATQLATLMTGALQRALMHHPSDAPSPPPCQILNNHDWQRDLGLLDFLDCVGSRMRLSPMLSRDSVQRRLQSESGLSFAELTYQLLQGYDFYHLYRHHDCRLQIGGSDQWGNMLAGVDMTLRLAAERTETDTGGAELPAESVAALTFPLLVSGDGIKMGKSVGNAVWLDAQLTPPFDLYQYFLRLGDADALRTLPQLTFLPLHALADIRMRHDAQPEARLAQKILGEEIVAMVHGEEAGRAARQASQYLFDEYETALASAPKRQLLASILAGSQRCRRIRAPAPDDSLLHVLHAALSPTAAACTKNRLRTLAQTGGIYIDGQRPTDLLLPAAAFLRGPTFVRIGKLEHYLVVPVTEMEQCA